jgi:hypothetical protein
MNSVNRYNALYPLALDVSDNLGLDESEQSLLMVKLNECVANLRTMFKIQRIEDICYQTKFIKLVDSLFLVIEILTKDNLVIKTLNFTHSKGGLNFSDNGGGLSKPIDNKEQLLLL